MGEKRLLYVRKWVGVILSRWVCEDDELSLSIEVRAMASCSIPADGAKMFWFVFGLPQNITRASL